MNCSPPCSSVHGILQARILEGVAMSFSRGSSQTWDQTWVSCITSRFFTIWDSLVAQRVESACNAGDLISIPGLGRSPGEENGNPLQYSCLESSMDRGVWWVTVHMGSRRVRHDWVSNTFIFLGSMQGCLKSWCLGLRNPLRNPGNAYQVITLELSWIKWEWRPKKSDEIQSLRVN